MHALALSSSSFTPCRTGFCPCFPRLRDMQVFGFAGSQPIIAPKRYRRPSRRRVRCTSGRPSAADWRRSDSGRPQVSAALKIDAGSPVWLLHRVWGWDGVPAVLSESWLHPDIRLSGSEDFRRPLYQIVHEAHGPVPALSREEITAAEAGTRVGRALRIGKSEPVLVRKRVILDARRQPIEFNVNYYHAERYTLTLDLARPAGDGHDSFV